MLVLTVNPIYDIFYLVFNNKISYDQMIAMGDIQWFYNKLLE